MYTKKLIDLFDQFFLFEIIQVSGKSLPGVIYRSVLAAMHKNVFIVFILQFSKSASTEQLCQPKRTSKKFFQLISKNPVMLRLCF